MSQPSRKRPLAKAKEDNDEPACKKQRLDSNHNKNTSNNDDPSTLSTTLNQLSLNGPVENKHHLNIDFGALLQRLGPHINESKKNKNICTINNNSNISTNTTAKFTAPINKGKSYVDVIKSQLGESGPSDVVWVLLHQDPELEKWLKSQKDYYQQVTTSTDTAAKFLDSLIEEQPEYSQRIQLVAQALKKRLDDNKAKKMEYLKSILKNIPATNVALVFFHQKPEFRKWARHQGWVKSITKSELHAFEFLSCLIQQEKLMEDYVQVIVEELQKRKIVVKGCTKCEKQITIKQSVYDQKQNWSINNGQYLFWEETLCCIDCFESMGGETVQCIKQLELGTAESLPHLALMIIEDLSEDAIVECVICGKEGPMKSKQFESRTDTKLWKFCENYTYEWDEGSVVCRRCFKKYLCTFCENIDEDNVRCFKCETVICRSCQIDGKHEQEHHERSISPPAFKHFL